MYVKSLKYLSFLPATTSKYAVCKASVIGPLSPFPITLASISLIGVTSTAVPVKNASSAI